MDETADKRQRGRPSLYTEERAAEILERLSNGEPLAQICRDDGMPAVSTITLWKQTHEGFAEKFARARDDGFDVIAADCLHIADTPLEGVREETTDDGKTKRVREDMLGHRKLQVETRLKLLAKWDPRRYGDKLAVGGADDLPPIASKSDVTLSPAEAYKRMLGGE